MDINHGSLYICDVRIEKIKEVCGGFTQDLYNVCSIIIVSKIN